jgi:hydrogenase expression/formation protein HypD
MGLDEYYPIANKYRVPVVASGFEPVEMLNAIKTAVEMLENGDFGVANAYSRVVKADGTPSAKKIIFEVFREADREWRGIGNIPASGYELKDEFRDFDANIKFSISIEKAQESELCIAGNVLKGIKKPNQCTAFGKICNPENPLGAPMVSSEGACAAYYNFYN